MKIDTSRIEKALAKLKYRYPVLFRAIQAKINQIAALDGASIEHFKNLRGSHSQYKRVHIGSFVLMFKVESDTIIFDMFRHHDDAY